MKYFSPNSFLLLRVREGDKSSFLSDRLHRFVCLTTHWELQQHGSTQPHPLPPPSDPPGVNIRPPRVRLLLARVSWTTAGITQGAIVTGNRFSYMTHTAALLSAHEIAGRSSEPSGMTPPPLKLRNYTDADNLKRRWNGPNRALFQRRRSVKLRAPTPGEEPRASPRHHEGCCLSHHTWGLTHWQSPGGRWATKPTLEPFLSTLPWRFFQKSLAASLFVSFMLHIQVLFFWNVPLRNEKKKKKRAILPGTCLGSATGTLKCDLID